MTHSLIGSLALDLLLILHSKVSKELPDVVQWAHTDLYDDIAEYSLRYAVSAESDPFCVMCISVSQFDPPRLFFQVDVDYESRCMGDEGKTRTYDYWITQYADMWPITISGSVDCLHTDDNGKTSLDKLGTKPRFKILYHVTGNAVGEMMGYRDSYGFDEVANVVWPRVKLLHELFKNA